MVEVNHKPSKFSCSKKSMNGEQILNARNAKVRDSFNAEPIKQQRNRQEIPNEK